MENNTELIERIKFLKNRIKENNVTIRELLGLDLKYVESFIKE